MKTKFALLFALLVVAIASDAFASCYAAPFKVPFTVGNRYSYTLVPENVDPDIDACTNGAVSGETGFMFTVAGKPELLGVGRGTFENGKMYRGSLQLFDVKKDASKAIFKMLGAWGPTEDANAHYMYSGTISFNGKIIASGGFYESGELWKGVAYFKEKDAYIDGNFKNGIPVGEVFITPSGRAMFKAYCDDNGRCESEAVRSKIASAPASAASTQAPPSRKWTKKSHSSESGDSSSLSAGATLAGMLTLGAFSVVAAVATLGFAAAAAGAATVTPAIIIFF